MMELAYCALIAVWLLSTAVCVGWYVRERIIRRHP